MSIVNEREYNRIKSEIEAEYRHKLDAVELVWKMSGGTRKAVSLTNFTLGKGDLHNAVRTAVVSLHGEFTIHDVESQIARQNPSLAPSVKKPSLSSALKRLASEGMIVLVATGSGKRPSKYRVGSVAASA